MKKIWLLITFVTLIALFFTTVNVMASGPQSAPAEKPKSHTPGARATERATEMGVPGNGNENGNGQPGENGKPEKVKLTNYKGTIESVDASKLTLKTKDGATLDFTLNDQTTVKVPTLGKSATVADLYKGENVAVAASKAEDESLVAARIMAIPGKPQKIHRVGVVMEYIEGESITIENKDGEKFTFIVTDQTKILPEDRANDLKVGSRVTIICPRDVAHGTLTAAGIVVHPEETEEEETGTPPTATNTETPTPTPTDTPTPTPTDTPTPTATFTETETFTPTP